VLLLDRLGVLLMLASGVRVSDEEADTVALAVRDADGEPVAVPLLVPAAQNAEAQEDIRMGVKGLWSNTRLASRSGYERPHAPSNGHIRKTLTAECLRQLPPRGGLVGKLNPPDALGDSPLLGEPVPLPVGEAVRLLDAELVPVAVGDTELV
jgi:hypothetical protein